MARCGNARARDRRHRRVPSPDHRNASLWHLPSGVRQRTPDARGRRCEVSRSCPSQSPAHYLERRQSAWSLYDWRLIRCTHRSRVCCRRRQRGAFRRAPVSSPDQYTRCNSKSKVSDRARSPARARTCYRRSSENPTAFASLRNAVSLLHDKASSSAGLGRYGVSFATRSACAPLHEEHQSRRVARVQVTYCAMPPPNDQFSFATSTRLITTSSARTFNCACMSSTMRL